MGRWEGPVDSAEVVKLLFLKINLTTEDPARLMLDMGLAGTSA